MSRLFTPLSLRAVDLRHRLWMSPMCMYSCAPEGDRAGVATGFHLQHLASRAAGGAGLILMEASAVSPAGRISPWDLGLWNDRQAEALAPIIDLCRDLGAPVGAQLAHAGRKASTMPPWQGGGPATADHHGWAPVGATGEAFSDASPVPSALDEDGIAAVIEDFRAAARRAVDAGCSVVEVHGAHGYLLHQFCSPVTNTRTDAWGGDLDGRLRLPLAVVEAVRAEVGPDAPVLYRLSATDWYEENDLPGPSWTLRDSQQLAIRLARAGVDLIDVSTGGISPDSRPVAPHPGYQAPHARAIKEVVDIPVSTVGLVVDPDQAEALLADGSADAIMLARELLRDPYAPARWQSHLDGAAADFPVQYERALPYR